MLTNRCQHRQISNMVAALPDISKRACVINLSIYQDTLNFNVSMKTLEAALYVIMWQLPENFFLNGGQVKYWYFFQMGTTSF